MRFRLQPTLVQEQAMLEHCTHARFVWNLAVKQHRHWRPGRASAPGYAETGACEAGSDRRQRVKTAIARLTARETDRRKDWVEKNSTDLARRSDVVRVEDLKIKNMVRSPRGTVQAPGKHVRAKAGLNRSIHAAGWGRPVGRLEEKAAGRVEKINPAYTSQTCNACRHRAAESRESQAAFRCRVCGHIDHADVNAAKNIAAGRAVTARGGRPLGRPANREPQPVLPSA
jgi:putative transposase